LFDGLPQIAGRLVVDIGVDCRAQCGGKGLLAAPSQGLEGAALFSGQIDLGVAHGGFFSYKHNVGSTPVILKCSTIEQENKLNTCRWCPVDVLFLPGKIAGHVIS